jgi:succinyl-CoA synthetase alpha subunit
MITLQDIRSASNKIVVLGNHSPLIQSILDFDYLSGKKAGSVILIMTGHRGFAKYFFGRREILIPTVSTLQGLTLKDEPNPKGRSDLKGTNYWFLNLLSGRRTLSSTGSILSSGLSFVGGALFAENVPELHSLQILRDSQELIVGPASVGLLVPGVLKLGPIGGITPSQILEGKITEAGAVAVLSASGGMTNELMSIATLAGARLSFALSFGGDRFPVLSPRDAFLLAESDPATQAVLYYGELGGEDEYELVKLKETGKFTKPVIVHIAGTVASLFPQSPQFGHAKAKADKVKTTALAKRDALKNAGFQVSNSFSEFISLVNRIK